MLTVTSSQSIPHLKAKLRTWFPVGRRQAVTTIRPGPRADLNALPQELLNLIVDEMSDSRADLASMCLASRALYGPARQHLCRSLTITTPRKSFAKFVKDLEGIVGMRQHIKHLTLSRFGMKHAEYVTAGLVSSLLELLPSLQTLTFSLVAFKSEASRDLWETPRPLRQLEELSFIQAEAAWQPWSCKPYIEVLSLFSDIGTLTFKNQLNSIWAQDLSSPERTSAPWFPHSLAVRKLRMADRRDTLWLPLLRHARTLPAPTLTALDIVPMRHVGTGDPREELRAALVTAGAQLATLRCRLWPDSPAAWSTGLFPGGPYRHVAELPAVARWCPRLTTFIVRVPLWCSLQYASSLFECIVALLGGLPPTVRTFALELDLEGHPWPAAGRAQECMPRNLWEMLKFAVERAGVARVNLVWLHLKLAAGEDVRLRQELSEGDTLFLAALESQLYTVQSSIGAY
ncbi:hypothetical protein PsYK624_065950 [Phanerochaete sordida]|uniref:Uncharacterized protein n=1 Tax=Phanerochaete sordida TaxID=48140 RepID=A0A9P3LDD0_9APHY|nr:hypothetical protein PsYK624_065950 [Phanerochaete sordida]